MPDSPGRDPSLKVNIVTAVATAAAITAFAGNSLLTRAALGYHLIAPGAFASIRLAAGAMILLPWFLPNVVAGHMWALMLDPRLGVINDMLVRLGILDAYKAWFADPDIALAAAMAVEVWHGFPFFALLLLAGLKAIPRDFYEAAAIDGARAFDTFRFIILPQLKAIIVAATILRVISLVNSPDIILILTGGGPGRATQVLSLYAFLKVSKEYNFGYGGALAVLLFAMLMAFSYLYVRFSNVMGDGR